MVHAATKLGLGTQSPGAELEIKATARDAELFVIERFNDSQNFLEFKDVSNDPTLEIFKGDGQTFFKINETGDIFSNIANAKISGSSTSTGSFGSVQTDGNVGVNTLGSNAVRATLHVADDNSFGGADGQIVFALTPSVSNNESAGMVFGTFNDDDYWKQGIFWKRNASYGRGELHFAVRAATDATTVSISDSKMMIDNSGNVGIGTDNPDGQLHVYAQSAGTVTAHGDADDLVVEAQNSGISILALDAGDSSIIWGSPSDNVGVQAKWNHDANAFRFRTSKSGAKMVLGGGDSANTLEITATEISGSSTSTGSFGVLKLAYYNQGYGGQDNLILGKGGTGASLTTGNENVLIGTTTGDDLSTGRNNVMIGQQVGGSDVDVDWTVQIGSAAGNGANKTSAADGSIFVGYASGFAIATGERNLALGYEALRQDDDCDDSIAIGWRALYGTGTGTNTKNIAIGNYALGANMYL